MAWCRQATSHYLSQCWPRSLSPYDVTRPQWVKTWHGWVIVEKDFHTSSISLLMMIKELRQNNSCSALAYFFLHVCRLLCWTIHVLPRYGQFSLEYRQFWRLEMVWCWNCLVLSILSINIILVALLLWECRHDFKVMLNLAHVFSNSWFYSIMRDVFFSVPPQPVLSVSVNLILGLAAISA